MNETTEKLIRDLAERLGTTTEHLWSVLIRQAPMTCTAELLGMLTLFAMLIYFAKKLLAWKSDGYDQEEKVVATALWALAFCLLTVFFTANAGTWLAGFVNPEFWALHQLLK